MPDPDMVQQTSVNEHPDEMLVHLPVSVCLIVCESTVVHIAALARCMDTYEKKHAVVRTVSCFSRVTTHLLRVMCHTPALFGFRPTNYSGDCVMRVVVV